MSLGSLYFKVQKQIFPRLEVLPKTFPELLVNRVVDERISCTVEVHQYLSQRDDLCYMDMLI